MMVPSSLFNRMRMAELLPSQPVPPGLRSQRKTGPSTVGGSDPAARDVRGNGVSEYLSRRLGRRRSYVRT
jgi:hypothetical protein